MEAFHWLIRIAQVNPNIIILIELLRQPSN